MSRLGDILGRLLNELPTIGAAVAAIWYVWSGIQVPIDVVNNAVENFEGLIGFVVWLHVRNGINGPLTNWRLSHEPPVD